MRCTLIVDVEKCVRMCGFDLNVWNLYQLKSKTNEFVCWMASNKYLFYSFAGFRVRVACKWVRKDVCECICTSHMVWHAMRYIPIYALRLMIGTNKQNRAHTINTRIECCCNLWYVECMFKAISLNYCV